ncbi:MAG: CHAT domain-containing protein [Paracoccaceae bacterium]
MIGQGLNGTKPTVMLWLAALLTCTLCLSHPALAQTDILDQAYAAFDADQPDEATRLANRALEQAATEGEEYDALNLLAEIYYYHGPQDRAIELADETDRRAIALLGEQHEQRLSTLERRAVLANDAGQPAQAIRLFSESLRLGRSLDLGPEERLPDVSNLAALYLEANNPAAATILATEAVWLAVDLHGTFSLEYAEAALLRAEALLRLGRPAQGLADMLVMFDTGIPAYMEEWPDLVPWFSDVFDLYDAAAAEEGEVEAIQDIWLSRAAQIRDTRPQLPADVIFEQIVNPTVSGDINTGDANARRMFDGTHLDDPRPAEVYQFLALAHTYAGTPDRAAPWLSRLAGYPPEFLASLITAPWDLANPVLSAMVDQGEFIAILDIYAAFVDAAAIGYGFLHPQVLTMRMDYIDVALFHGDLDTAAAQIEHLSATPLPPDMQVATLFRQASLSQGRGNIARALDWLNTARHSYDQAGLTDDVLLIEILNLATHLELAEGRPEAALVHSQRSAAALERVFGKGSRELASTRFNVVLALSALGRTDEAVALIAEIRADLGDKLQPGDPFWDTLVIAELRMDLRAGRVPDFDSALAALDGSGAFEGELRLTLLTALAQMSYDNGRADLTFDLITRARAALPDIPHLRHPLDVLEARLRLDDGDPAAALALFRAVDADAVRSLTGASQAHLPYHLVALQQHMNTLGVEGAAVLMEEAFALAQRINTTVAGEALGQAAARWQVSPGLGTLLRAAQDTETRIEDLRSAVAQAAADGTGEAQARAALQSAIDTRSAIDADITTRFPDYAAYAGAQPVSLAALQAVLAPDEAAIVFSTTDIVTDDGYGTSVVTLVLHDQVQMAGLTSAPYLRAQAETLRCAAALTDPRCALQRTDGLRGSFDMDVSPDAPSQSFDFDTAHQAYLDLLEPFASDIADKRHLIFVPDANLVAMPFHLLLSTPHDPGQGFTTAPWLIRDHAISVVPSVASLYALRQRAQADADRAPSFLGVGDPLIGRQANGAVDYPCATPDTFQVAALAPDLTRAAGGIAASVRGLSALPETRCELRDIAVRFGNRHRLLMQGEAEETRLKSLSDSGALADYSVVSFATHGLIAGEIGNNEAALVMTPPAQESPESDGLLTTAEIAALRLNADFVILSACNTGSGGSVSEEGLSGLASAFFYAGARNLLVSHWPVYSDAAVDLTTRLFDDTAQSDRDRAAALRRAMLSVLDDPDADTRQTHPAYWAPFMLIGAGG